MAAFALTRLKLRGRRAIYLLFVIGIAVPTQVGVIQLALQMSRMHLTNSLPGFLSYFLRVPSRCSCF